MRFKEKGIKSIKISSFLDIISRKSLLKLSLLLAFGILINISPTNPLLLFNNFFLLGFEKYDPKKPTVINALFDVKKISLFLGLLIL